MTYFCVTKLSLSFSPIVIVQNLTQRSRERREKQKEFFNFIFYKVARKPTRKKLTSLLF